MWGVHTVRPQHGISARAALIKLKARPDDDHPRTYASLSADRRHPKTSNKEVLIQIGAAGLNNTDINTRVGWYSKGGAQAEDASWGGGAIQFLRIQGADICGTVVEVGEGADTALFGKRGVVESCLQEAAGQRLEPPW